MSRSIPAAAEDTPAITGAGWGYFRAVVAAVVVVFVYVLSAIPFLYVAVEVLTRSDLTRMIVAAVWLVIVLFALIAALWIILVWPLTPRNISAFLLALIFIALLGLAIPAILDQANWFEQAILDQANWVKPAIAAVLILFLALALIRAWLGMDLYIVAAYGHISIGIVQLVAWALLLHFWAWPAWAILPASIVLGFTPFVGPIGAVYGLCHATDFELWQALSLVIVPYVLFCLLCCIAATRFRVSAHH